jgi:MarR family transcriptional regulator for hemolysin
MQETLAASIVVTGRRWRARLTDILRETEQTDARWNVLNTLARSPAGVIQAELAGAIGVQGPTLVKLLDALEEQGLIRRQIQSSDRRAKAVYLEPAGASILEEIQTIAASFRDTIFEGIPDDDLAIALNVLEKACHRLTLYPDAG